MCKKVGLSARDKIAKMEADLPLRQMQFFPVVLALGVQIWREGSKNSFLFFL